MPGLIQYETDFCGMSPVQARQPRTGSQFSGHVDADNNKNMASHVNLLISWEIYFLCNESNLLFLSQRGKGYSCWVYLLIFFFWFVDVLSVGGTPQVDRNILLISLFMATGILKCRVSSVHVNSWTGIWPIAVLLRACKCSHWCLAPWLSPPPSPWPRPYTASREHSWTVVKCHSTWKAIFNPIFILHPRYSLTVFRSQTTQLHILSQTVLGYRSGCFSSL